MEKIEDNHSQIPESMKSAMDDTVNSNNIDSLNDLAFELSMDELSEDSECLLKDVTPTWILKPMLEIPQPMIIPICLNTIKLIDGENLASFLKRNPYKKNKNNIYLSNVSNKLKHCKEKRYTNWIRDLYYCYNNIDSISILNSNLKEFIMKFLENPTIESTQMIIDMLELSRKMFEKKIICVEVREIMNLINSKIKDEKNKVTSPMKAFNYLLKPFIWIKNYISIWYNHTEKALTFKDVAHELKVLDNNLKEKKNNCNGNASLTFSKNRNKKLY